MKIIRFIDLRDMGYQARLKEFSDMGVQLGLGWEDKTAILVFQDGIRTAWRMPSK